MVVFTLGDLTTFACICVLSSRGYLCGRHPFQFVPSLFAVCLSSLVNRTFSEGVILASCLLVFPCTRRTTGTSEESRLQESREDSRLEATLVPRAVLHRCLHASLDIFCDLMHPKGSEVKANKDVVQNHTIIPKTKGSFEHLALRCISSLHVHETYREILPTKTNNKTKQTKLRFIYTQKYLCGGESIRHFVCHIEYQEASRN